MTHRYMMATQAHHRLGDISRVEPDLCIIQSEDAENYIGNWVEGLGFIDVRFPKVTTRELTTDEIQHFHGRTITMGGRYIIGTIDLEEQEP